MSHNSKATSVGFPTPFGFSLAISDPIRPDVPAAVAKCQSAGIGIKIVTGDTPGTATEIARQIGLWKPETDTDRNRITGVAFAELSDEEALDRVMDLKIMSRARPTDKQRLVQLLQQKGAVQPLPRSSSRLPKQVPHNHSVHSPLRF